MSALLQSNLDDVAALRAQLWDAVFRPVALKTGDKMPLIQEWPDRARRDPPADADSPARPDMLNTGILCDGLRVVDIDVDDSERAGAIKALALEKLGSDAPIRWRDNSPRVALLYRAADGAPRKLSKSGTLGKIEILGYGNQVLAFGTHPSGARLQWEPEPPGVITRDALPVVTEEQVTAFLDAAGALIGAQPGTPPPGADPGHASSRHGPSADIGDVVAALHAIPNNGPLDWGHWNNIGLAVFAATGGGQSGKAAWLAWSEKHPNHNPAACEERWAHYDRHADREPKIGAGTLFHLAAQAQPGWRKPSEQNPPADDPWPTPDLTLATADTAPAPALDITFFPGRWQPWLTGAAERAGAPVDYVVGSLLASVGAAIGNARWGSPWEGWAHPPVIWVACIGNPSAGKSPGINAAAVPMSDLGGQLNDDWEERARDYRTLKQAAKECRATWEQDVKTAIGANDAAPQEPASAREPNQPRKRRIYSTDPTVEKARDLSAANPRGLLLHRDELAGWVASMGKYGNGNAGGDRGFWLQAYEGGRWSSDRVKDGDDAPDIPHLTWGIVGGFQPDRLASTMLAGDDDGLTARFLYLWPAAPAGVSDRPSGGAPPFDLVAMLRRLRDLPMPDDQPVILPFDDDAGEVLQEFRQEAKGMEADRVGLFLSWTGKLPGFSVRLATVFAHLAWLIEPDGTPPPDRITLDDVVRAIGFLNEYAVPMARRAFGEAALPEAERDARRLARWYLRRPVPRPAVVNARALRRMEDGPGIPTAPRIEAALSELAELGWVRPAPKRVGGHSGRQRADWAINPAAREASP